MDQRDVLGRLCRDRISGAEGICIGTIDWMFGCRYYVISPKVGKKGHFHEGLDKEMQVAEPCIEIIDVNPVLEIDIPENEDPKFFGDTCRDIVTDYEGLCIARLWIFYSEKQYLLQGKYNKKKMIKQPPIWVDEGRIEVLTSEKRIEPKDVQTEYRGGIRNIVLPDHY